MKGNEKTRFKKGKSGNPKGRPKMSKEIKKIRTISREEMTKVFHKYMNASQHELEKLKRDKSLPAKELAVIVLMLRSVKKEDAKTFDMILDRAVGKVPNKIEATGDMGMIVKSPDGKETHFGTKKENSDE